MEISEIYDQIRELQDRKDELDEKIKDYKNLLDKEVDPERDPELKIVHIPTYVENQKDYLAQRFPTFNVESIDGNRAKLREKENFVPKKVVFDDGGQFYRRISRGKPTVNLELLKEHYPEHYEAVVKYVPELDEEKLVAKIEEDPTFLEIIEEVIEMSRPSVSLVAQKPTGAK